jgi:hypothetical protein
MNLYEYERWMPCGAVPQARLGTGLCARGYQLVQPANRGWTSSAAAWGITALRDRIRS